jgi:Mrp family chromosome partitioning ATPase
MEQIPAPLQEATRFRGGDRLVEQAVEVCARFEREVAWDGLPVLTISPKRAEQNRIVTFNRSDPAHGAFDVLRTRLLRCLQQNGWTSVAITSPRASCGKSLIALNLAFSLANQADRRTILMDMNLKEPRLEELLGVNSDASMADFLTGRCQAGDILRRYGDNLAIGTNSRPVQCSAELLQSRSAAAALRNLRKRMSPDVLLFDLSSMLPNDDVIAFLGNVDCVILVAAAEQSSLDDVDACERELSEQSNVAGVVLNRCRYGSG